MPHLATLLLEFVAKSLQYALRFVDALGCGTQAAGRGVARGLAARDRFAEQSFEFTK
jgi:hypothetical protein